MRKEICRYSTYELCCDSPEICDCWYEFTEFVWETLRKINPDETDAWIVEGKDLGWQRLSGEARFEADNGLEFMKRILPRTSDFTVSVFEPKGIVLEITCSHHDGSETYRVIPGKRCEVGDCDVIYPAYVDFSDVSMLPKVPSACIECMKDEAYRLGKDKGEAVIRFFDWDLENVEELLDGEAEEDWYEIVLDFVKQECWDSEENSRQYSPFEFTAAEFNAYGEASDEVWSSYERGIDEAVCGGADDIVQNILDDIRKQMDEKKEEEKV